MVVVPVCVAVVVVARPGMVIVVVEGGPGVGGGKRECAVPVPVALLIPPLLGYGRDPPVDLGKEPPVVPLPPG